jgi:hypothetical protein
MGIDCGRGGKAHLYQDHVHHGEKEAGRGVQEEAGVEFKVLGPSGLWYNAHRLIN